jgi:hypothetical protein
MILIVKRFKYFLAVFLGMVQLRKTVAEAKAGVRIKQETLFSMRGIRENNSITLNGRQINCLLSCLAFMEIIQISQN